MKQITIVIPTRNRLEKLLDTFKSIPEDPRFLVWVVCDEDSKTYNHLSSLKRDFLKLTLVKKHSGSVYCRNLVIPKVEDGCIYATDDIIFEKGSIEHSLKTFNEHFPDDDGVLGFIQRGAGFHPTGVALVGQKFLQRYPEKILFYPEYYHFCCQEVYSHAMKLNKFFQDRGASLVHKHPLHNKEYMDETHREARLYKSQDFDIRRKRSKAGLIWGLSGEGTN